MSAINRGTSAQAHAWVLLLRLSIHTHADAADGLRLAAIQGDLSTVYVSGQWR